MCYFDRLNIKHRQNLQKGSWDHKKITLMGGIMFITLLDSSYEFYCAYHGFKATFLEVQRDNRSGVQDFVVLAPFHSSKVTIFITAGSVWTPHNWMRVKRCNSEQNLRKGIDPMASSTKKRLTFSAISPLIMVRFSKFKICSTQQIAIYKRRAGD